VTGARALFDATREQLVEAQAPQEGLGRLATPGRVLRRRPRIQRAGSAWRLGALLLTADGDVLSVGEVLRAAEEVRRGYAAESARERAAQRAAAVRGGFRPGEIVHVGWSPVDLEALHRGEASGPLQIVDGTPMIRWSAAADLAPLEPYLRERVDLLRHPPAGA
jgi:integrase